MAVKVTITVELASPHLGDADTQTLTAVRDMTTQPADWFAAPVVEQKIAEAGANLVRQVAGLHGDIRDERPGAVVNSPLRARPITGEPALRQEGTAGHALGDC